MKIEVCLRLTSVKKNPKAACSVQDISTKSFFLGPQAENGAWFGKLVDDILERWLKWRRRLYPADGAAISVEDLAAPAFQDRQREFEKLAVELSERFESEIPKFSPRYMGHMFSEISLPALIGHWIATLHNPNTVAFEVAPVGVEIEREAIAELVRMARLPEASIGHFTSCGSIANFEATLRARDRVMFWLSNALEREARDFHPFYAGMSGWAQNPIANLGQKMLDPLTTARAVSSLWGREYQGPVLMVPENKHYSWVKSAHLLGLGVGAIRPIELSRFGTMNPKALNAAIEQARDDGRPIAAVVSVLGTTELGNFDPVDEVQALLSEWRARDGVHVWHHIDAAYGGFFLSLVNEREGYFSDRAAKALRAVGTSADSITIDPHKLGYVPYACGAFICARREDYLTRTFDSPYIDFQGIKDPGPFTLEGSRSASGAAATWMTMKAIGTGKDGYGRIVGRTIQLRRELAEMLKKTHSDVRVLPHLDSNILCFTFGPTGGKLSASNQWVKDFFARHSGPRANFFVSKTTLTLDKYAEMVPDLFATWDPEVDTGEIALLRLALMNPFLRSKEMNVQVIDEFCSQVRDAIDACQ